MMSRPVSLHRLVELTLIENSAIMAHRIPIYKRSQFGPARTDQLPVAWTILDDEDICKLNLDLLHCGRGQNQYACIDGQLLHRVVMNAPAGMHVHHRNYDKLDNRRSNLEVMTSSDHAKLHGKENTGFRHLRVLEF